MHARTLLALCLAACSSATDAPPLPFLTAVTGAAPTVVVIMTDDQRPDLFTRQIMPFTFAALVDSGTLYTNAHANTPVCCPSRASFLTGKPQHVHGVLNNFGPGGGAPAFDPSTTIATELQAMGWLTALHGKYLNLYDRLPQPHIAPGWSEWKVSLLARYWGYTVNSKPYDSAFRRITYGGTLAKDHETNVLKRAARDLIFRVPVSQPLFLLVTPLAPHKPWTAQASDVGSCNALSLAPRLETDVSDKPAYVQALPAVTAAQVATLRADWRKQCETLKGVDRLVNEVVSGLRARGRLANATLMFTSDNGLMMGEHRLFERKHSLYATPVPLAIRLPGAPPAVVDAPVGLLDVAATVRHVAGLPVAYGTPLVGGAVPPDVPIEHLVVSPVNEKFTALRTADWLYAEYPSGGPGGAPFLELYDLRADPGLLQNRANDAGLASIRASLAATLAQRRSVP